LLQTPKEELLEMANLYTQRDYSRLIDRRLELEKQLSESIEKYQNQIAKIRKEIEEGKKVQPISWVKSIGYEIDPSKAYKSFQMLKAGLDKDLGILVSKRYKLLEESGIKTLKFEFKVLDVGRTKPKIETKSETKPPSEPAAKPSVQEEYRPAGKGLMLILEKPQTQALKSEKASVTVGSLSPVTVEELTAPPRLVKTLTPEQVLTPTLIRRFEPELNIKPEIKTLQVFAVKPVMKQLYKQETKLFNLQVPSLETRQIKIQKQDVALRLENIPRIREEVVPKQMVELLPKPALATELSLSQKPKLRERVSEAQRLFQTQKLEPQRPVPVPKLSSSIKGMEQREKPKKEKSFPEFRMGRRKETTIYPDLLSIIQSELKYGKATFPKFSAEEAEKLKFSLRVPTVELRRR
jgi:hypothetical protein